MLLMNVGGTRFADASAVTGFDFKDDGRGLAVLDIDGDGDLDVVTSNRTAPRVRILRNEVGQARRSLSVLAEGDGETCHRDAIGTRIEVRLAGRRPRLVRTVRAGEGYLSQSTRWQVFGLSDEDRIESVQVRWPGGARTRHLPPEGAGRLIVRPDGSTQALAASVNKKGLSAGAIPKAAEGSFARCLIAPALPAPRILIGGDGSPAAPTLVLLWSRGCGTCKESKAALERVRVKMNSAGVSIVERHAEDLDGESQARFQGLNDALVEDHRPLPVPFAILLDRAGGIAALYRGSLDFDSILRDIDGLDRTTAERRNDGVPYPGRWVEPTPLTDLRRAGDTLQRAALARDAEELYALDLRRSATPRTFYNRAGALRRLGRLDEAMEAFRRAMELDETFVSAHAGLAMCLHDRGDFEAAQKTLERAVALDPNFAEGWYDLGLVRARRGRFVRARFALEKSLALNPDLTDAWLWLAHVHEKDGDVGKAAAALRKARENRGSVRDVLATARFRLRRGREDGAARILEAGLRDAPGDVDLQFELGFVMMAQGRDDAARTTLERALALASDRAAGHHALGVVHARNGRLAEAVACFERTLELDAGRDDARRQLERARRLIEESAKDATDE